MAEVLQVINGSPGNLAPVLDAMLETAMRLCQAAFGTLSVGGEQFHVVAQRGVPAKLAEYLRTPYQAVPGTAMGQFSDGEQCLNITDLNADPGFLLTTARRRAYAEFGGARSILSVPLRKDETLLGAVTVYRQKVRPFTERQIELVSTFADQAVIAIENARLFNELRERTEELTRREDELRVTFDNMGDGVAMFDREGGSPRGTAIFRSCSICRTPSSPGGDALTHRDPTLAGPAAPAVFSRWRCSGIAWNGTDQARGIQSIGCRGTG